MIKKWKYISRNQLLDHPRMKIVEDTVELPNGKQTTYIREAYTEKFSVAVIAINDAGELLIQQEYSYPPDEIMYQLPGGGGEGDEDIIAAANRELSEESGYTANDCKVLGHFYVNNRRSNIKQHVVLCKSLQLQKLQQDDEEFIESEWASLDTIEMYIREGKLTNVNMLAALHLYKAILLTI